MRYYFRSDIPDFQFFFLRSFIVFPLFILGFHAYFLFLFVLSRRFSLFFLTFQIAFYPSVLLSPCLFPFAGSLFLEILNVPSFSLFLTVFVKSFVFPSHFIHSTKTPFKILLFIPEHIFLSVLSFLTLLLWRFFPFFHFFSSPFVSLNTSFVLVSFRLPSELSMLSALSSSGGPALSLVSKRQILKRRGKRRKGF